MNPFAANHEDRDGNVIPVLSLEAQHLVNIVNFKLRKSLKTLEDFSRRKAYEGYAPLEMDARTARTLGLRLMNSETAQNIEDKIRMLMDAAYQEKIYECIPYLIVGMCRDDTREGVVKILQEVTGITGRIELPSISMNKRLTDAGFQGNPLDDEPMGDDDEEWEDDF